MDIRIVGKHTEITNECRSRIEKKLSKLPQYYSSILDVEVIVEGNEGVVGSSRVEIIVRGKHNHVFVARQTGQDMYTCVDDVVKKIETQLKKHKQKERDDKHPSVKTE